jgi:ankyrin repeat protein
VDVHGTTALHYAAACGDDGAVALLLRAALATLPINHVAALLAVPDPEVRPTHRERETDRHTETYALTCIQSHRGTRTAYNVGPSPP